MNRQFLQVLDSIDHIGQVKHRDVLIANAKNLSQRNLLRDDVNKLRDEFVERDCIIVSAGPSILRENTLSRLNKAKKGSEAAIVCMDASLIRLLKLGIVPDYCVVIDPHPTRMLRWFGDPWIEEHLAEDEYFIRQDLDVAFRDASLKQNQENIELLNQNGSKVKVICATTVDPKLVDRFLEIGFKCIFWFTPLVDNPDKVESLTKYLYQLNGISCMNTGGNVGCASWIFANHVAQAKRVGAIGMDYSYYDDVPLSQTQTYPELMEWCDRDSLDELFVSQHGIGGKVFYQDPTFYWYCDNFISLVAKSPKPLYNLTEAGLLMGENIVQSSVESFLNG